MDSDPWTTVRDQLLDRLRSMPDEGVVILTGPEEAPADVSRRGLFRRRPAVPTPPYVQFLDVGGSTCAECVGPGLRDIPQPVQDELAGLGWTIPLQDNPAGNYQRWFERVEATAAAELGVRTLELLGADPATLEFRAWAD